MYMFQLRTMIPQGVQGAASDCRRGVWQRALRTTQRHQGNPCGQIREEQDRRPRARSEGPSRAVWQVQGGNSME